MTLLGIIRRIGWISKNRYHALEKKRPRNRFNDQRPNKLAVQIIAARSKIIVDLSFELQAAIYFFIFELSAFSLKVKSLRLML
jgi:hypothetical protein